MSNQIKTRMSQKHDIQANWEKAVNFIPLAGEIIFYDPDETCVFTRMKVGDGEKLVSELPFFGGQVNQITTADISHADFKKSLAELIDAYVLEIDYEKLLAFDVTEIVTDFNFASSLLGKAVIGKMILGRK